MQVPLFLIMFLFILSVFSVEKVIFRFHFPYEQSVF